MDITDLIVTCLFIVLIAVSINVIKIVFGLSFWLATAFGFPVGCALVMFVVWLFIYFSDK